MCDARRGEHNSEDSNWFYERAAFSLNIGEGEYLKANPMKLMQQPYGRVIVFHITIIAGGFLVTILQSPIVGLLLLVVLKIGLDLRSHLREHRANILPVLPQSD